MSEYASRNILERLFKKYFIKERVSEGNKKLDNLIGFLFITGIILMVWEIFIYRRTMIGLKIPLIIWLTPGLFLSPILFNKINNIDGMKANIILHYILHTVMTGSIILFCFMALNYYLGDSKITEKRFEVIKTGNLAGRGEEQYVVINYDGFKKQLVFKNTQDQNVLSAKSVKLIVRRGLFGFDVLEKYEVK
jgi:hypothetical protein